MQIKSRGIRVSPEEVERCLHASNLLAHVVGFAIPRRDGENEIVVAVAARDPSCFQTDALQEFWRREMPEYMWPRHVWVLPALPLTSSGKPDRTAIRQLYVEQHSGTQLAPAAARTT
jgi:crotonobetaine/carnitine-CoA ligase